MDYPSELQQLQQEGELPLDQLLASLPTDILEGKPLSSEGEEDEKMEAEQREEEEAMEEGEKPSKKSPKRKRFVITVVVSPDPEHMICMRMEVG